jgi:3-hydroxymyristoyl/3-hydroxydecanoyl-(acyl carrier protein) dehydratase
MEKTFTSLYPSLATHCLQKIVQTQSGDAIEIQADFIFDDTFSGFNGHFPGKPVLPGIIQLAAVRFLAEHALEQQLQPVSYNHTKFSGIILPNDRVQVRITLKENGSRWSGHFWIEKFEQDIATSVVTKGQCDFSPETGDRI